MVIGMQRKAVNITTRELAELIPVDPSTIRRWVEQGKLVPAVTTPGGHFRFDRDAALAQLAGVAELPASLEGEVVA